MKDRISINNVELSNCFKNEKYEGFVLSWDSNIGFGEMTFLKQGNETLVETETMSNNEDKEFIRLALDKFIEKLKVIE